MARSIQVSIGSASRRNLIACCHGLGCSQVTFYIHDINTNRQYRPRQSKVFDKNTSQYREQKKNITGVYLLIRLVVMEGLHIRMRAQFGDLIRGIPKIVSVIVNNARNCFDIMIFRTLAYFFHIQYEDNEWWVHNQYWNAQGLNRKVMNNSSWVYGRLSSQ